MAGSHKKPKAKKSRGNKYAHIPKTVGGVKHGSASDKAVDVDSLLAYVRSYDRPPKPNKVSAWE